MFHDGQLHVSFPHVEHFLPLLWTFQSEKINTGTWQWGGFSWVFAEIGSPSRRRLADSPSRGVLFRVRIPPRIRSPNRNGSKGSGRDLWGTNFCKNPRKSENLPHCHVPLKITIMLTPPPPYLAGPSRPICSKWSIRNGTGTGTEGGARIGKGTETETEQEKKQE